MTTNTGPAELRRWALMSRNPKATALFECATAWEADIAALERARALAEAWKSKKYNGDLTAAVYHGCAEELAAALSAPDGAR